MPNLGPPELLLILAIVLLLFGAKKLPDFARSLGKAKTEFRKGIDEGADAGEASEPADNSSSD